MTNTTSPSASELTRLALQAALDALGWAATTQDRRKAIDLLSAAIARQAAPEAPTPAAVSLDDLAVIAHPVERNDPFQPHVVSVEGGRTVAKNAAGHVIVGWARELSAAEIQSYIANPFQMFKEAAPEATPSVRKISEQLHAAISRYCPDAQARIALMSAVGRIVDSILPASTGAAPEAPTEPVAAQFKMPGETWELCSIDEEEAMRARGYKFRYLYASTGAAPEAPASEQQAEGKPYFRDLEFDPPSGLFTTATSLDHSTATTASASDGSIYESVSRRADPVGHAEAMDQIDELLGRAAAPSRDAAPDGLTIYRMAKLEVGHPTIYQGEFVRLSDLSAAQAPHAGAALDAMQAEIDRLTALLNTPETLDFMKGLQLETAHQRERWSTSHDGGKAPADWFWLIGYLAQKAMMAQIAGNTDKALHHTISTAAALANWHAAILGNNDMRPGIEPPPDAAMSAAKQGEQG